MIRINLLPVPKVRRQEALIIQAVAGIGIFVGVFILCNIVTATKKSAIEQVNADIAKKQSEIEELKAKVGEVEKFKTQAKNLESQLSVIRTLEQGRSGPVKLLDELTELIPRKLWINSFREQNKTLAIEGIAESGPVIADFLDSLKSAKYFQNAQLGAVTAYDQGNQKLHKFTITIQARYDI